MSYYDWKNILKSKSTNELIQLLKVNSRVDLDGQLIALDELAKRKYDADKLKMLKQNLINHRLQTAEDIKRITFEEKSLKKSPYVNFMLAFFMLLVVLYSGEFSFNNLPFLGFLGFSAAGIVNFYTSKNSLKKIEEKRNRRLQENQKKIEKIKAYNPMPGSTRGTI